MGDESTNGEQPNSALTESWVAFWRDVKERHKWNQDEQLRVRLFGRDGAQPSSVSKWVKGAVPGLATVKHLLSNSDPTLHRLHPDEKIILCNLWLRSMFGETALQYLTVDIQADHVKDMSHFITELQDTNSRLEVQATQLSGDILRANEELALRRREAAWVTLLDRIDDEIFLLLSASRIGSREQELFAYSVFQRGCAYFGEDLVRRSCIFIPHNQEPVLTIAWNKEVGDMARDVNRWYIGDDPIPPGMRRGIPGAIFFHGEMGRVVPVVAKDPDYFDVYNGQRIRPYDSLVQALITSPDGIRKLGVLSFDSNTYRFTHHDLAFVCLLARRLGWLLDKANERSGLIRWLLDFFSGAHKSSL